MASLLKISGEHLQLEPNRAYVLGRDSGCDIAVEDMICSRRHARLTLGTVCQSVFIDDLDSRNGTYVNEERISDRTPLDNYSGIRIGATVFLFCLDDVEDREDAAHLDTATVAVEALTLGQEIGDEVVSILKKEGRAATNFAGHLDSFSVIEVLQLLIQTAQSGTLHVALEGGRGTIELRYGEVCSATCQDLEGFPALLQIASQKRGMFWLVQQNTPCRITIKEPASRILFDLCHALDESKKTAS